MTHDSERGPEDGREWSDSAVDLALGSQRGSAQGWNKADLPGLQGPQLANQTGCRGLRDLPSKHDEMDGANFSEMDIESGFAQMEITEEDKHKTAFQDTLWNVNRCGFGLKNVLVGFVANAGGELRLLRGSGVKN